MSSDFGVFKLIQKSLRQVKSPCQGQEPRQGVFTPENQKICNLLRLVFCRRCCWFIILIQEDPCYSFAFSVDCRTGIEVDLMRSWGLLCLDLYLQNPVGVVRSAMPTPDQEGQNLAKREVLGFWCLVHWLHVCGWSQKKNKHKSTRASPLLLVTSVAVLPLFVPKVFCSYISYIQGHSFCLSESSVSNIAFGCGGWSPPRILGEYKYIF